MLLKTVFVSIVLGIALSNGAPSCCGTINVRVDPEVLYDEWAQYGKDREYYQDNTANGRVSYTSNDGKYAIWYDNRANNWAIGSVERRGTTDVRDNKYEVFQYNDNGSEEYCPNNLNPSTWFYQDWNDNGSFNWENEYWGNTQVGTHISCSN